MRIPFYCLALLIAAAAAGSSSAFAGGGGCMACSGGGYGGGGHFSRGYPGLDRHFNCGCGGSYKYPVPPLSTYHWPGLYSHHLMTEYHSPWRFPPIKPYQDEKLEVLQEDGAPREALPPAAAYHAAAPDKVQSVDFPAPTGVLPGVVEPISSKLRRVSRYSP